MLKRYARRSPRPARRPWPRPFGAAAAGWDRQRRLLQEGRWLPQTESFAQAYSRRNHLQLLQILTPMEKLKRDQLVPILSQWRDLLSVALTCRAGLPAPDPLGKALASGRTSRSCPRL